MNIKHILVDMDPQRESQPALDRAINLAKLHMARVTLFLAVHSSSVKANWFLNSEQLEKAKSEFIKSQLRWLETFVPQVAEQGVPVSVDVVWHTPLYEAINEKVKNSDIDLVVKSTHVHPTLSKLFFTPNDWQLLKTCTVPLLMAKSTTRVPYENIMAAIDPLHDEGRHAGLNHKILQTTVDLSKELKIEPQVVHCCEPIYIEFAQSMPEAAEFINYEEELEYRDALLQHHKAVYDSTLAPFNFSEDRIHMPEGETPECLLEQVKEHHIDLLVIGTTFHTGLVGGTAEKILDKIPCDLLAVKTLNEKDIDLDS
ncbi:MAG TPA: hypothetical protein ENJ60_05715 [Aeromonadales bacterium]|nr:hypothetical protein [Aeromonadales bacterium]